MPWATNNNGVNKTVTTNEREKLFYQAKRNLSTLFQLLVKSRNNFLPFSSRRTITYRIAGSTDLWQTQNTVHTITFIPQADPGLPTNEVITTSQYLDLKAGILLLRCSDNRKPARRTLQHLSARERQRINAYSWQTNYSRQYHHEHFAKSQGDLESPHERLLGPNLLEPLWFAGNLWYMAPDIVEMLTNLQLARYEPTCQIMVISSPTSRTSPSDTCYWTASKYVMEHSAVACSSSRLPNMSSSWSVKLEKEVEAVSLILHMRSSYTSFTASA